MQPMVIVLLGLVSVSASSCFADDVVSLSTMKIEIGRQSVAVQVANGEAFSLPFYDIDVAGQTLKFGSPAQPRVVRCSDVRTLQFEPKARRRQRRVKYVLGATVMFPVAVGVLAGSGGTAAPALLIWPGGYVWWWPLSHSLVKRQTRVFQVSCK